MTDLTLISSLYKSEPHLARFLTHVSRVAGEVRAAGISLELVVVANDASAEERRQIDLFASNEPDARVLYVGRESLYASWNRGIASASGRAIGFWNADDVRTAAGLIDGLARIDSGCELVYFAFDILRDGRKIRTFAPAPSDTETHRRRMQSGPFFLFRRDLYQRVGPFDERFQVVGDWEWCVRALEHAAFCHSAVSAGQFTLHGGNLSNTGRARDLAESNVVRLLTGRYGELTPAPPDEMRAVWALWSAGRALPPEVEHRLWGDGAQDAWERWRIEEPRRQSAARRRERLRAFPKWLIDRLGLRPLLARFGLVKARAPR